MQTMKLLQELCNDNGKKYPYILDTVSWLLHTLCKYTQCLLAVIVTWLLQACAARGRVVGLSVSQLVSGRKMSILRELGMLAVRFFTLCPNY